MKNIKILLPLALVSLMSVFIVMNSSSAPAASKKGNVKAPKVSSDNLSLLHVENGNIINQEGKEIKLKGFNVGGLGVGREWYYSAVYKRGEDRKKLYEDGADYAAHKMTQKDIDLLKEMGVTAVRLWLTIDKINDPALHPRQLELLDETIDFYGKNGIYTIINFYDVGERDASEIWARTKMNLNLWENTDGIKDKTLASWEILAKRYKNNPYVAGYNFLNEPSVTDEEVLYDFYKEIITVIRKYDKNHIVFPETDVYKYASYDINWAGLDDNLVVNHHFYQPFDFHKNGGDYPGKYHGVLWDYEHMNKYFSTVKEKANKYNKPVIITEFGFNPESYGEDGIKYMKDALNAMNENDMHFLYYDYKMPHQIKSFLVPKDYALEKAKLTMSDIVSGRKKWYELTEEEKLLLDTRNYTEKKCFKELFTKGFSGNQINTLTSCK